MQGEDAKLPQMKGSGAEMKKLLVVVLDVFVSMMVSDNAQHRDIKCALEHSIAIDEILDSNARRYTLLPADARALQTHCWEFAKRITSLIKYYHPLDINLFHFTIKTHLLLHIGLCSSYINPVLCACDQGEDMMKVVKRLLKSSADGCNMKQSVNKAMTKYVRGISFDLHRAGLKFS